jgi:hypothetical protein
VSSAKTHYREMPRSNRQEGHFLPSSVAWRLRAVEKVLFGLFSFVVRRGLAIGLAGACRGLLVDDR